MSSAGVERCQAELHHPCVIGSPPPDDACERLIPKVRAFTKTLFAVCGFCPPQTHVEPDSIKTHQQHCASQTDSKTVSVRSLSLAALCSDVCETQRGVRVGFYPATPQLTRMRINLSDSMHNEELRYAEGNLERTSCGRV